jgi:fatty acid desaturase
MASVSLRSRSEYAAVVRPLLPPQAFVPSRKKLWHVGLHIAIIGACVWGIRELDYIAARFVFSAIIGHSLTCMVFLAHELSHGGIMRRSRLRYPLEVFLWGLNLIPATMWRKIHNENHHVHANTLNDPDRYFMQSEFDAPGGTLRRWYARWTMPHKYTSVWNLGVGFHFITYALRHLVTVFYPGKSRPAIVTFKPDYRPADRRWIIWELVCIVAMQYVIYLAVGGSVVAWLWAGPGALLFTSTYAMSYIWTNHYLHGFYEMHDPLVSSTSVEVPKVFDRLHSNFSYHTEHHLFPGMNSEYYPLVSDILREQFPDRYHRITYRQAWRQLWKGELFIVDERATPQPHFTPGSEPAPRDAAVNEAVVNESTQIEPGHGASASGEPILSGPHGEFAGASSDARPTASSVRTVLDPPGEVTAK